MIGTICKDRLNSAIPDIAEFYDEKNYIAVSLLGKEIITD
jgi:hypothetical protein